MNIVKHISIPAATLALLTAASSCQQDELTGHVDDNAQGIRFTAYTDAVTRGAEVTSDNLGSFKVYAFGDGSYQLYQDDGVSKDFTNPEHLKTIKVTDGTVSADGLNLTLR